MNEIKSSDSHPDDFPVKFIDSSNIENWLENVGDLGDGAFGFVNLVKLRGTEKLFALKRMKSNNSSILKFREEHRILQLLSDLPEVLKFEAAFGYRDNLYILTEICRERNLNQLIGELNPLEARWIAYHLAQAIHKVHTRGVKHNDLKPGNILFGEDFRPKLCDFGTASHLSFEENPSCAPVIGTEKYKPPEINKDLKKLTLSADWFCFGMILYRMLTNSNLTRAEFDSRRIDPVSSDDSGYVLAFILTESTPENRPLFSKIINSEFFAQSSKSFYEGSPPDSFKSKFAPKFKTYRLNEDIENSNCSDEVNSTASANDYLRALQRCIVTNHLICLQFSENLFSFLTSNIVLEFSKNFDFVSLRDKKSISFYPTSELPNEISELASSCLDFLLFEFGKVDIKLNFSPSANPIQKNPEEFAGVTEFLRDRRKGIVLILGEKSKAFYVTNKGMPFEIDKEKKQLVSCWNGSDVRNFGPDFTSMIKKLQETRRTD